jgi:hypothetical protein
MSTTYKRDDPDFKAKLSARADELTRARTIRPYSPTISQQFVALAEDQELAEIRLEQIKLRPIVAPKTKKTSWLLIIAAILFVIFSSLIFGLIGFAVSLFLVCFFFDSGKRSDRVFILWI